MMKEENDGNFAERSIYDGSKANIYLRPIFNVILSIGLLLIGLFRFVEIQAFENGKTDLTLSKIEGLLYRLGGKYLILAFVVFASLYFLYRAYHQYKNIAESKKKKFT
jgi:hypothetical protein